LKLRATRAPAQGRWTNSPCTPGHNTPLPLERSPPASFKRLLGCQARERSANMEPLEINHEAQKRLNHAENQQRDVVAPSPESPAQTRDKCARREGKE